jgi:hypothetical protein
MKTWTLLIAGVVLVITPQIIVGVVAANMAWVQSSYLHTLAAIESQGAIASDQVVMHDLPTMPDWMMLTSMVFGIVLCVISVLTMLRAKTPVPHATA